MPNFLVCGVAPEPTYTLAEQVLQAGHHVTVSLWRELAIRKLLTGLVDVVMLDSGLSTEAERQVFSVLGRAIPTLPVLLPRGIPLPEAGRPAPPRRRVAPKLPLTEPLLRAVSYLYGVAEGRRLAIPAEVDLTGTGGPRLRGLATDMARREILVEFLPPAACRALAEAPAVAAPRRAVGRLRFPGGGTLRVEGVVRAVPEHEAVPTGIRLRLAPAAVERQTQVLPVDATPARVALLEGLLASA